MTEQTIATYEYAGFQFSIVRGADGEVYAQAKPGQHPAAYKGKHARAAILAWSFEQDTK